LTGHEQHAMSPETPEADAPAVITVDHLHKAYGATVAVDDVSFSVRRGEIFGVLGRNGAGKTTTVECISGLRVPDGGDVQVLGLNPRQDRERLHERLGVQLQQGALPPKLKVGEAVQLYASFYRQPADPGRLLETLGLETKRSSYWRALSGGQKQRLSIVLALIGQPEVAILDELTTGLDPEARRQTWDLIEGVRKSGVTIVLVTHFMEEAERLCDRVALIDQGRVRALGKPAQLGRQAATAKRARLRDTGPLGEQALKALPEVSAVEHHGSDIVVVGSGNLVTSVVLALDRAGLVAEDVRTETANLEDAFLALTAHAEASGAEASGAEASGAEASGAEASALEHKEP
jgi:ABC-2 type transport system ATP-binding protein